MRGAWWCGAGQWHMNTGGLHGPWGWTKNADTPTRDWRLQQHAANWMVPNMRTQRRRCFVRVSGRVPPCYGVSLRLSSLFIPFFGSRSTTESTFQPTLREHRDLGELAQAQVCEAAQEGDGADTTVDERHVLAQLLSLYMNVHE